MKLNVPSASVKPVIYQGFKGLRTPIPLGRVEQLRLICGAAGRRKRLFKLGCFTTGKKEYLNLIKDKDE